VKTSATQFQLVFFWPKIKAKLTKVEK